jgi:hypothetical protein
LFRVKGANAVLSYIIIVIRYFAHIMSNVITMWQTSRSSNITSSHDSFVFDNDTAAPSTIASSTFGDSFTQI